jgi:ATP-dependent Clp protease ATP-binding subunit ClpA
VPLRTARHDIQLIADLLTRAESEALALGDPEPGAEHLLVAALMLDDDSARTALGVDAPAARDALRTVHATALAAADVIDSSTPSTLPPAQGLYRSRVSMQEVFQRAKSLAHRSPTGLRAAHVLIAIAEREHGTAARVLDQLGIDRGALIAAATAEAAR